MEVQLEEEVMVTDDPAEHLKAQRLQWQKLWQASDARPEDAKVKAMQDRLDHVCQQAQPLRAITQEEARRASRSFKQSTSRPTGLHPRYLSWATDEGPWQSCSTW